MTHLEEVIESYQTIDYMGLPVGPRVELSLSVDWMNHDNEQ